MNWANWPLYFVTVLKFTWINTNREIHELESALLELKRVVDIESYLVIPNPLEPSSDYEDSSYLPSQTDEESEEIGSSVLHILLFSSLLSSQCTIISCFLSLFSRTTKIPESRIENVCAWSWLESFLFLGQPQSSGYFLWYFHDSGKAFLFDYVCVF